jgi:dTDP-4-dehydrorhamnose 3,5-epimerase
MEFIKTDLTGVFIVIPEVFKDSRGYFCEIYRDDLFKKNIGTTTFVQDNESQSSYGVLRGLHYQLHPYAQSKLVRAVYGSILDIAVDIRKDSSTYGKHFSIELSHSNKKALFIPQGFAHGFIALSEYAIVQYKVDNFYSRAHDRGIDAFDGELAIDWKLPLDVIKRSDKDKNLPCLREAEVL